MAVGTYILIGIAVIATIVAFLVNTKKGAKWLKNLHL